jgi:hypothetical protein
VNIRGAHTHTHTHVTGLLQISHARSIKRKREKGSQQHLKKHIKPVKTNTERERWTLQQSAALYIGVDAELAIDTPRERQRDE